MVKRNERPSVLFVCTGNICRSPFAAGLFSKLQQHAGTQIHSDSAGIHAMLDAPAAPLSVEVAAQYQVDLNAHRARQLAQSDYQAFSHLIALDFGHFDFLRATLPAGCKPEVALLMSYVDAGTLEVPDPYMKKRRAFEQAAELIKRGVGGLLEDIRVQYQI